jgi:hypothetical protein
MSLRHPLRFGLVLIAAALALACAADLLALAAVKALWRTLP